MIPPQYFLNPEDRHGPLRLLAEEEWRSIGIQQSLGWEHYEVHGELNIIRVIAHSVNDQFPPLAPEPHVLLFRRAKNYQPPKQPQARAAKETTARRKWLDLRFWLFPHHTSAIFPSFRVLLIQHVLSGNQHIVVLVFVLSALLFVLLSSHCLCTFYGPDPLLLFPTSFTYHTYYLLSDEPSPFYVTKTDSKKTKL